MNYDKYDKIDDWIHSLITTTGVHISIKTGQILNEWVDNIANYEYQTNHRAQVWIQIVRLNMRYPRTVNEDAEQQQRYNWKVKFLNAIEEYKNNLVKPDWTLHTNFQ